MRDLTQIETRATAESAPSPRLSGERAGVRGFDMETEGLLTPALSSLRGGEGVENSAATNRRELWLQALSQGSVWLRALKLGFTTGLLQAAVNQGDRWLSHSVDHTVVLKTIVSPLIGFTLVLFSAAATWVERTLEQSKL